MTTLEEESNTPTRRARVTVTFDTATQAVKAIDDMLDRIRALLPENYKVAYNSLTEQFMITGHDVAGWTLEDYVIPRLVSGLVCAEEITE